SGADGPADDAVVAACVDVLREWQWSNRPVAVASIPSRHRPELVRSVAARLAPAGRLVDLGELAVPADVVDRADGAASTGGGNGAFRLADVWDAWQVTPEMAAAMRSLGAVPPILLVDDLVDSRWTMTVAGRTLRLAGAGDVLPFALASSALDRHGET